MREYRPNNWGSWLVRVGLGLLALAIGARLIYDLLAPLIPWAVALVVLGVLALVTFQRWRR